jgi:glutamate transport system permease protein
MSELRSDIGPQLWPAYWVTLKLTLFSANGALIWGTVLAAMRVSPVPVMRVFGTWYVNIVRNTPVLAFVLYTSTFVCKTLRSGFNTVPVGQAEAARSLGLPFSKVFGIIVLPQAIRSVIGPAT